MFILEPTCPKLANLRSQNRKKVKKKSDVLQSLIKEKSSKGTSVGNQAAKSPKTRHFQVNKHS